MYSNSLCNYKYDEQTLKGVIVKLGMLRSGLALAALGLFMNSANAADADMKGDIWTGAYVGVHAGYAKVDFENGWCANTDSNSEAVGSQNNVCIKAEEELGGDGAVWGGHAGYNQQFGSFVLGVEADVSQVFATSNAAYEDEVGGTEGDLDSARAELDINALASVRARLGFAAGDFMFFATGGMGYIDADYGANTDDSDPLNYVSVDSWTTVAGAGIEWRAMEHVSLRLEGLHYFETDMVNVRGLGDGDAGSTRGDLSDTVGFDGLSTIRIGANYHF